MNGPNVNFDEVVILPKEDNGRSICRIVNAFIDGKRENHKEKFFRDDAVTIINKRNGKKVVRFSVGNGTVSLHQNQIALDYNARDKLGVSKREALKNVNILVRPSTMRERFMFFWNHENRADRFSMRGAVIGSVLGGISLLLGILSVILAL